MSPKSPILCQVGRKNLNVCYKYRWQWPCWCAGGFGSDYATGRGGGPVKTAGFTSRTTGPYAGLTQFFQLRNHDVIL